MKKFSAFLLASLLIGCVQTPVQPDQKLSVVATFYPLAFLAEQIGGEFISTAQITPGGVEPHDYEPTPQQLASIHDADLFLMNGAGLDGWAEKISGELESEGVMTVNMASALAIVVGMESSHEGEEEVEEHEEDEYEGDDHGHEEGAVDPHFWLNPLFLQAQAELVRDAFVGLDPAHESEYRAHEQRLMAELKLLDVAFRNGLARCLLGNIIVSHDAFGYMANEYGFETIPVAGLSPEEEPSSGRIAEIADIAEREGIDHIFFETLVSSGLAQTIADEIGARTLVLNPIEGLTSDDVARGKDYFSLMQENLQNLRIALQCQ